MSVVGVPMVVMTSRSQCKSFIGQGMFKKSNNQERDMAMSETKTFTKDPTCGMTVDEATALKEKRDGRTYFFCSDQCLQQFISVSNGESVTCCG